MSWVRRAFCSGWFVLALIGAVHLLRGVFYLPPIVADADRVPAVEAVAPLWAWVVVWFGTGLFAVGAALLRRAMVSAVSLVLSVNVMWALLHFSVWVIGESPRGYMYALTFGMSALFIVAYYTLLFARIPLQEEEVDVGV